MSHKKQKEATLKRRRQGIRRLGGHLPPGAYVATAVIKDGVLGLTTEGFFVPMLDGAKK
jgi:hypothetical protein